MTATQLANQALLKLSAKMITSIEATNDAVAMVCKELLQPSLDTFCTGYRWSWCEQVATLTYVADPSPAPVDYDYEYQVPTDFLQLLKLKDEYDNRIRDYVLVTNDRIRCNSDTLKLYYVSSIAPDTLPVTAIDAFTSYYAHRLSPSVDGGRRMQLLLQLANQKGTAAFMEDAAQRPSPIDEENYNARVHNN